MAKTRGPISDFGPEHFYIDIRVNRSSCGHQFIKNFSCTLDYFLTTDIEDEMEKQYLALKSKVDSMEVCDDCELHKRREEGWQKETSTDT